MATNPIGKNTKTIGINMSEKMAYELLVMRGHMFSRLRALTKDNREEIRAGLLGFLNPVNL